MSQSCLDLLKVCVFMYSWNRVTAGIYCVNLLGSIDRELDSINPKSCRMIFLQNFQLSPSPFDVQGFMFCLKYKRENPSHILRLLFMLCVIQMWLPSHIFRVSKIQDYVKNLVINQLQIQKLKDTLAGVLVLAGNPRKKQSVDSELSRGHGSKFPTRGSNRMLVV